MRLPIFAIFFLGVLAAYFGLAHAADAPKHVETPNIVGPWSGTWGAFDPATLSKLDKQKCKGLDCTVVKKEGVWVATFEGDCGGPYKYTITMEGRQSGEVILFKGSVDLGEKGGGIYDWVGRANNNDFVGFYTSSTHIGVFQLSRKK
jgi:hypothetical protein